MTGVSTMDAHGDWIGNAMSAAFGSIITGLVTWVRTRKSVKSDMTATLVKAAQEAAHLAVQDVTSACGMLRTELASLRNEIINERRICDERLAAQQHQINRLMMGHAVTYGDETGGPQKEDS